MNQLGLPFSLDSKMLLDNFVGKKNQQILDFISQLSTQKAPSVVYVYGGKSSGRTHLLQGCAFAALKEKLEVTYIDFNQDLPDGVMDNLESLDWVCLDNVNCLNENQQQELFDLYNRSVQTQVKLIMSGDDLPTELNLLKDLKTRLSLATIFHLESLDDDSKKEVIQSKMKNRNIAIENKVYDYLFKYYSRNLTDLLKAIDCLDEASLQQKNNITIPLIKQVLSI
ncbi:MAG: DnaA family protein [uncultured Candidatus Thioglobus sp.]|jgi:DnaA family protein|nr:MAG: DnaA family protein [uncultured Candidatus Thioglobus sp.]MBT5287406.1 DnaA regulatory inactivator Hda [Candidatus Thioglobus sp.]MBT6655364.1 DnaA regulatory inactivator Hda [Candidatus Thioglobus sp.]